jgi:hypothetical protein
VLCEKCHKKKTSAEAFARVRHGTRSMYNRYGCRCAACRAEKSKHNALRKVLGYR